MIRSYILRGSNFLLPFKMFYQQQTLAISYFFFFWLEKYSWFYFVTHTLKHSMIPWFLHEKIKTELDIWNGYERFCAADF